MRFSKIAVREDMRRLGILLIAAGVIGVFVQASEATGLYCSLAGVLLRFGGVFHFGEEATTHND